MRRFLQIGLVFLVLAAAAGSASAANPFYLTGKLGSTSPDGGFGELSRVLDGDDDSLAVGLGFRLGRYLAFQAEWHDFGTVAGGVLPCSPRVVGCVDVPGTTRADSSAVSLSFLPHLWLGKRLSVYGKLGFVSWESDVDQALDNGARFFDEFSDEDLIVGGGLRLMLPGPFAAFAEYENVTDAFETVSLGVTYGF